MPQAIRVSPRWMAPTPECTCGRTQCRCLSTSAASSTARGPQRGWGNSWARLPWARPGVVGRTGGGGRCSRRRIGGAPPPPGAVPAERLPVRVGRAVGVLHPGAGLLVWRAFATPSGVAGRLGSRFSSGKVAPLWEGGGQAQGGIRDPGGVGIVNKEPGWDIVARAHNGWPWLSFHI